MINNFYNNYSKKKSSNINIEINNVSLSYSNSFKFLGGILDSRLLFNVHINHVVIKVSKNRGIYINLSYLLRSILLSLYFSLVYLYFYIIVSKPKCGTYASTIQTFLSYRKRDYVMVFHIMNRLLLHFKIWVN